jgi:hypothetical protein
LLQLIIANRSLESNGDLYCRVQGGGDSRAQVKTDPKGKAGKNITIVRLLFRCFTTAADADAMKYESSTLDEKQNNV